jgi:hypothetical protein
MDGGNAESCRSNFGLGGRALRREGLNTECIPNIGKADINHNGRLTKRYQSGVVP